MIAEFEAVCTQLQSSDAAARGQAEACLLQLRAPGAGLDAISQCKEVLQHSAAAAAQFHAAMAIRDVLVRDWDSTPPDFRAGLRAEMLEHTVARYGDGALESVVQQQLLQLIALCYKRGWLEDDGGSREGLMQTVTQLLQSGQPRLQALAFQLTVALTNEFSCAPSPPPPSLPLRHRWAGEGGGLQWG